MCINENSRYRVKEVQLARERGRRRNASLMIDFHKIAEETYSVICIRASPSECSDGKEMHIIQFTERSQDSSKRFLLQNKYHARYSCVDIVSQDINHARSSFVTRDQALPRFLGISPFSGILRVYNKYSPLSLFLSSSRPLASSH